MAAAKSAKSKPKARKTPKDPRAAIIAAAMTLAARDGWRRASMSLIAAECGLGLTEVLGIFPSKTAILNGLSKDIDAAVLADLEADNEIGDNPRDRLFDILMRRFDAMQPYRDGIAAVLLGGPADPMAALCHLCRLRAAMALMLNAAGESTDGLLGHLRIKGLGLIYANALRAWIDDDSADMSATMAAVDRGLARAEGVMTCLENRCRAVPDEDAAETSEPVSA